jgi:hypothetical protein
MHSGAEALGKPLDPSASAAANAAPPVALAVPE